MTRKRNEGGRYSTKNGSDWYRAQEEANIRKVEAEWQGKQQGK